MNKRILVAYATRAGSTAEVAAEVGSTLSQRGFLVDVKPVKEVQALEGYQAIVLGSAVRMGNWLPEMVDFVKAQQQRLGALPVSLFTVHLLNLEENEASRAARQAYLQAVRPLLRPTEEAYFAGKMDFSRLSFFDRMVAKLVKAVETDRRDWNAVRAWAETVFA